MTDADTSADGGALVTALWIVVGCYLAVEGLRFLLAVALEVGR